ncbi:hypothetical protein CO705_22210 [Ralstonia pickettii]|nr:hypothetical protein CO705_22210 [Ralstonia pickettii]
MTEVLGGYHDATLLAIDTDSEDRTLTMRFRTVEGNTRALALQACEFFRASDFVAQNVVSRLILMKGHEQNVHHLEEKLRWASSRSDATSFLSPERLALLVERIIKGELTVLYLEPSSGAELVALFSSMHENKAE